MRAVNFIKKWLYDIDKTTLFFSLSLIFLGLLFSLTISPAMAHRIFIKNDYYFTIHQIIFCIFGILIMLFCSMLSKTAILKLSFLGFFFCFILLCVVLAIGGSIKGSKRWIDLGFFSVQPSELMKPFFIVVNAYFLSISGNNKFLPVISVASFGTLVMLFMLQPDFGSAIIYIIVWFAQIFLSNVQIKVLLYFICLGLVSVGIIGFLFFSHVYHRVISFFTLRGGQEQYQTKKAIESIYNGGLFGKGLGEGEVKYQLPDAHTDYIFSVICEELGIVFAACMMIYFLIFAYRHLASNMLNSKYSIRVIYGIVLLFIVQSCIHIAVNTNMFPSKGMTLPFVSYGGSSLFANSIMFGFLLAFTRKGYNYRSPYEIFENAYSKK